MIRVRPGEDRAHAQGGWLDSRYSFSAANRRDPLAHGFSTLLAINEDRVAPDNGFTTHPHWDVEIVTLVLDGALVHRDRLGHRSVLCPGDVQRMTAGAGISHSELNASETESLHLLQIWIAPDRKGLAPGYEQRHFDAEERLNRWRLIVSPDGRDGSLRIHQDARLYIVDLEPGRGLDYRPDSGRKVYVQMVAGAADLNGQRLWQGDGAAVTGEEDLSLSADGSATALLFDLAP